MKSKPSLSLSLSLGKFVNDESGLTRATGAASLVVVMLLAGGLNLSIADEATGQVPFGASTDWVTPWILNPYSQDLDGDGLSNTLELAIGSNPASPDTDNDRLPDGIDYDLFDVFVWDADYDGLPDYWEYTRFGAPVPASADKDGDGPDFDGDGTPDEPWDNLHEYTYNRPPAWVEEIDGPWLFGTNPRASDSDLDGRSDGDEAAIGDLANIPNQHEEIDAAKEEADEQTPLGSWLFSPAARNPLTSDPDGDGLSLYSEYLLGSDPYMLDTDADGLCDGYDTIVCVQALSGGEAARGMDPASSDSDGDGINDLTEFNDIQLHADLDGDGMIGLIDADHDGDGLIDGDELSLGANYHLPDTDGDGLDDGFEEFLRTSPVNIDSDADGLTDMEEYLARGNPLDADADGDGLNDLQESVWRSAWNEADTDLDGVPDGIEVAWGTLPAVPDGQMDIDLDGLPNVQEYMLGTDGHITDSSGDGMGDGWKRYYRLDPTVDDSNTDSDGDGLLDRLEFEAGTNPLLADSDGDLLSDALEVLVYGTSPNHFDSDVDGLPDGIELYYWNQYNTPNGRPAWQTNYLTPNLDCDLRLEEDPYCKVDGVEQAPNVMSTISNLYTTNVCGTPILELLCDVPNEILAIEPTYLVEHNNLLRRDADGDGLSDGHEFMLSHKWATPSATGVGNVFPILYPTDAFSNGKETITGEVVPDGLMVLDLIFTNELYRSPADQDGDLIADADEIAVLGSSPSHPDSDCDGLPDGLEFSYWDMPNHATTSQTWKPWNDGDIDVDGAPDGLEINLLGLMGRHSPISDPARWDMDGDGIVGVHETGLTADPGDRNLAVPCFLQIFQDAWLNYNGQIGFGPTPYLGARTAGGIPGIVNGLPVGLPDGGIPMSAMSSMSMPPHGLNVDLANEFWPPTWPAVKQVNIVNGIVTSIQFADEDGDNLQEFVFNPMTVPGIEQYQGHLLSIVPDTDGDGLSDWDELLTHNTSPTDCDSDDDGLGDGLEVGVGEHIVYWHALTLGSQDEDPLGNQVSVCEQFDHDSNTHTEPLLADTDREGASDGLEDTSKDGKYDAGGTEANPLVKDTDSDGVEDLVEYNGTGKSWWCADKEDCDRDGLLDNVDGPSSGTYGEDYDGDNKPNHNDKDLDDDGLDDGEEGIGCGGPWGNKDAEDDQPQKAREGPGLSLENIVDVDSDQDFLPDGLEAPLGMLACAWDTDGDDVADGLDILDSSSGGALIKLAITAAYLEDNVDVLSKEAEVYVNELAISRPGMSHAASFRLGPGLVPSAPFGETVTLKDIESKTDIIAEAVDVNSFAASEQFSESLASNMFQYDKPGDANPTIEIDLLIEMYDLDGDHIDALSPDDDIEENDDRIDINEDPWEHVFLHKFELIEAANSEKVTSVAGCENGEGSGQWDGNDGCMLIEISTDLSRTHVTTLIADTCYGKANEGACASARGARIVSDDGL